MDQDLESKGALIPCFLCALFCVLVWAAILQLVFNVFG